MTWLVSREMSTFPAIVYKPRESWFVGDIKRQRESECGIAQQLYLLWWRLNEEYFSIVLWVFLSLICYCCFGHVIIVVAIIHSPFPLASLSINTHKCYTYFYSQNTSNSMYMYVFILKAYSLRRIWKGNVDRRINWNDVRRLCSRAIEQSSLMRVHIHKYI